MTTETRTSATHTPIPWEVQHHTDRAGGFNGFYISRVGDPTVPIARTVNEYLPIRAADAKFIVRAVNNHDALRAACRAALPVLTSFASIGSLRAERLAAIVLIQTTLAIDEAEEQK